MAVFELTVSKNGQITIPVEIRRSLGIEAGDRMFLFRDADSGQMRLQIDVVARAAGVFRKYIPPGHPTNIDEIIALGREAFETGVAEEVVESLNWQISPNSTDG